MTCEDLLYRPLIDESWVNRKTLEVKAAAFRRRKADKIGLSVNVVSNYSVRQCIECQDYRECFAVGTLHTGHVLDIEPAGLSVERDSFEHANIIGLPAKEETGAPHDARREFLANELVKQWRGVWYSLAVRLKRREVLVATRYELWFPLP